MIRAEQLTRMYRTGNNVIYAIKDISFQIHEGDYITITGRSGSGKSTLLYQLGLLDYPTSGTVYMDDVNVSQLGSQERTQYRLQFLGYVFQDYALVPTLSAVENVAVVMKMLGYSMADALEIAGEALEKVGLGDRKDNLPSGLSGGEQQRVSIARAIVNNPKILFADEPTANLDSETADKVMKVFSELHKSGQTIVMVTHEPEYKDIGNRRLSLSDGQLLNQGD